MRFSLTILFLSPFITDGIPLAEIHEPLVDDIFESLVKVGDLQNYHHGIYGEVFMANEKTLVIKGFTYDGAGPDAFFLTGTSTKPGHTGTILPYPFEGKFFDYEDKSAPILDRQYDGTEEIT